MHQVVERRKNRRLRVPRDAFVALRPDYVALGQITDVSMNGLCFRGIAWQDPSHTLFELDIFLAGRPFYLYKVPFTTIWAIKENSAPLLSSIAMRQTGVRFGKLSPAQISQLKYFIDNYAVGEA